MVIVASDKAPSVCDHRSRYSFLETFRSHDWQTAQLTVHLFDDASWQRQNRQSPPEWPLWRRMARRASGARCAQ